MDDLDEIDEMIWLKIANERGFPDSLRTNVIRCLRSTDLNVGIDSMRHPKWTAWRQEWAIKKMIQGESGV